MKNYKKDLENARDNNQARHVYNKGVEHANIFMQVLLDGAKESVKIYTKKFDNQVSSKDGFIKSLQRVLADNKIEVKILMEETSDNSAIVKLISQYNSPDFNNEIKIDINKKIKDCIIDSFDGNNYHFTVVDKQSYRLEEDTILFKAYGSFGYELDFTEGLDNYFNFCFKCN